MAQQTRPHVAYYVYILASKPSGTLYIGVTNDLIRRVHEHKDGNVPGFTKTYGVHRLVYFEVHDDIEAAIVHEKQMKEWRRAWKIKRIEADIRTGMTYTPRSRARADRWAPAFAGVTRGV